MSFNKIILVGNLGQDPELRYTPSGIAVCNISVATSEKKRDKSGELQDITTWFRVTLWRERAEAASKYLEKGRPVYVEGRLQLSEWKDNDGNTRQTLEVTATDMQFIGGRGSEMSAVASTNSANDFGESKELPNSSNNQTSTNVETPADDDIPF